MARKSGAKPGASGLWRVALITLIVTPSGALSPGPLSASAIAIGFKLSVLGGLLVALGHMAVELPYVLILFMFFERVVSLINRLEKPLSIVVALFILFFSFDLIATGVKVLISGHVAVSSTLFLGETPLAAIMLGVVFTGGNVYFLLWWVSVGFELIRSAQEHGARGFAVMYAAHVWMDYVWLAFLAAAGYALSMFHGYYAVALISLGVILLVFGIDIATKPYRRPRRA